MGCPRLRDVDVKHPGLRWTSLAIYLGFIFALVALFTGSWSSGSAGFRAGLLYSAAPAVNLSSVVYFRDCIGTHPVLSLRLAKRRGEGPRRALRRRLRNEARGVPRAHLGFLW